MKGNAVGDVWVSNWTWGIPMLLASIVFHVCGLVGLTGLLQWFDRYRKEPSSLIYFLVMILVMANALLLLHVLEVVVWAYLYMKLDSVEDFHAALLFSLNAITAYGHTQILLEKSWRLLGAIESMSGIMIFGLTTAFMFNTMLELRAARSA